MSSSERPAGRETARTSPAGGASEPKRAPRRPTRAELIWDGKYDADGRRVAPLRVALPFQTVETSTSRRRTDSAALLRPGIRETNGATG